MRKRGISKDRERKNDERRGKSKPCQNVSSGKRKPSQNRVATHP